MSLFFVNERRAIAKPAELVPDWDAALVAVSKREWPEAVAAKGSLTIEQARKLAQDCRRVEPLLLSKLQSGELSRQGDASDFLRAETDGFFPAAKFIALLKANVGSKSVPATWAQVVTAAQTEEA